PTTNLRTIGNICGRKIAPRTYKRSRLPKEIWRRRPDLNRGWRFCRPLPYLLATAPRLQCGPTFALRATVANLRARDLASRSSLASLASEGWSGKRDSNPRLRPWQGRTLPLSYSRSNLQRYHHNRTERKTLAASSGAVGLM